MRNRWSLLCAGAVAACLALAAPAEAAPPANDAFASATVAGPALPVSINGTNVEATAQTLEPNHKTFGVGPHRSVWYRWTAPASGTTVIDTCTSNFDTTMGVYTGSSVGGLAEVAKNDDDEFCANEEGSRVTISAVAGTTYRIAVDGFDLSEEGTFTLVIRGLSPPANDNFASRQTIGPGLPIDVSGTTLDAGAEVDEPDHLGFGQAAHSIWYGWTPSAAVYVEVDACASQAEIAPAVYTGSTLQTLGLIAGSGNCRVTFSAAAGTSYKIALDSFVEGTSDLEINVLSAPANDNFVNRQTIGPALPATAAGSIEAATVQAGEPNHFGFSTGPRRSVWYQWTAPAGGQIRVDTCDSESAVLPAVYTGTAVNSLTLVADSDNKCFLIFTATAGTAYSIALDGFSPTPTELLVRALSPPANDAFANRQTIGPGLPVNVAGTTLDATAQAGETDHGLGGGAQRSVWYQWTPSSAAQVKVSVCQSNMDFDPPAVAVYTGSAVASLTAVGTSDGCSITFNAAAGTAYKVAIDASDEGPTLLDVHVLSPPPNDSFANRETVGPGLPISDSGTTVDATAQSGEPDHLGLGDGAQRSIWYGWTPATTEDVSIDACGSSDQVGVAVYTGSAVNSLTLRAGGDLSCAVSLSAVAGTSYKIALDGFIDSPVSLLVESTGSTPDPPDPPVLESTFPASGSDENNPRILGSAEAGSTVVLYANSSCVGSPVGSASATALNSPGIGVTVMDNTTTTFYGTAENTNGTSGCSAGITYVEVTPPPAPLGLTVSPASGSNNNNPTIGGSAAAGTTVRLYANTDCDGSPVATGTAAAFGSVGFTVAVADNSTTEFRATAQNANGISSCSAPVTYTEVTGAPPPPAAPTGLSVTPASGSNDNSPEVSGSAVAGTTVRVFDTAGCTGGPVATGTASQFASPGLTVTVADNSTTTFHATAENANGTSACSSATVTYTEVTPPPPAPGPPTGLGVAPASGSNDNSPEISGTAEAGTTVTLYDTADCTGAPVAVGTASQFASPGLTVSVSDNSTRTFRATAQNANGTSSCSTSSVTYTEVTPPPPPARPNSLSVTPASGSNDNSPKVSGNAVAGTTVKVYSNATCTGAPEATGTAAQFASPGLTVAVPDNSTTTFRATAENANGTSSCSVSSVAYTEVTPSAPTAPTGLSVSPASGSNDNSPKVSGTAQAGTTVRVYANAACTGSPAATGTAAEFASPGLAVSVADNSTTTFHATAQDANGTSGCSASSVTYAEVTAPPPPPAAPTGLSVTPASGSNDNSPKVSGSAEAGTTVKVYSNSGCTGSPTATGTAAQFASPGLTVSVPDNTTKTFHATATNGNGTSSCSTSSVTYTEVTPPPPPPAAPTGLSVTPASGSDNNNPKVSGSAEAGTTVKVYANAGCTGSPEATGTAASFGSPGLMVSVADNSTTTFHATASNVNGTSNCSTASVTYTEVTPPPVPPAAPTGLSVTPVSGSDHNNPKVSGSAEAGTTVKIYANATCTGSPEASGTTASFGSPGLMVSVADNSTTTFHATASNGNGTSDCSTASVTYTEVTEPPPPGPPAAPTGLSTNPGTGEDENSPKVKGTAPTGTTVKVYVTADCTGAPVATGTAAEFASPGFLVAVADNSTTTFRATAENVNGTSPCSTSFVTYAEVTRTRGGTPINPVTTTATVPKPATNPSTSQATGRRAAALRKCKRMKGRARANCLKRAKKLPA